MRILHVHDRASFQGGVEQILFDTARGLSDRGWPQALLSDSSTADSEFTRAFELAGHEATIIESFRPDAVLMHKVSDAKRLVAVAQAVPSVHMVHDHDLVCPRHHKYFPISHKICNKPAGLACYLHLCCLQRTAEGSRLPIKINGTGNVKRQLYAGRSVRQYLVGSHYMKKELEINGIPGEKIEIVHPVPAALETPHAHQIGNALEVLFVGQVIRGKGVDLLLRALSCLRGDWHANIVGGGNQLDECQALSVRLGIRDRVNFIGPIDHNMLDRFYTESRLLVVPSRWPEPFGMVGIEAMARGRPVVAFDNGGIADWLDHGVTGLLVPPANVSAMTSAIQSLLDDPSLAKKMGTSGVVHVKNSFSHQAYLDQVSYQMRRLQ